MEQVLDVAGVVALPFGIASLVTAIIVYWIAKNLGDQREVVRVLKAALDRDPSPAQLNQALQQWPQAAQFPPTHQVVELRKLAREDENRRAKTFELAKGWSRVFLALAVLAGFVYVGLLVWNKFKPEKQPAPVETPPAILRLL